jgi:ankyrin repeat protein
MLRVVGLAIAATMLAGAVDAAPIHDAAVTGDFNAMLEMIKSGVSPNLLNEAGETPLIIAARAVQPDVVNMLVHNGADPNLASPSGTTPLHAAATSATPGAVNLISFLYEKLANLDAQDSEGATPLMLAADVGNGLVVVELTGMEAELEVADNEGRTALTRAGLAGQKLVVNILLRRGGACQPDIADWTAACEARKTELGIK